MSTLDNLRKAAKRWLRALRSNDADAATRLRLASPGAPATPGLRDVQHALARELGFESWNTLRDAQDSGGLGRYETLAEDLLSAYVANNTAALERLQRRYGHAFTLEDLRTGIRRRVDSIPACERLTGEFALPHARLLVAREVGFASWVELERSIGAAAPREPLTPRTATVVVLGQADTTARMTRPVEMRTPLPYHWQGITRTTIEVWEMLSACRAGNLDRVTALVDACPGLVVCDYNYMSPLHLAVREGHVELLRYLIAHGGANPNYVTYPYRETLVMVARDRGFDEVASLLEDAYRTGDHTRNEDEGGEIDYGMDDVARHFQKLLNGNAVGEIESVLKARPDLALNPFAFWSEGVLMMPAKLGNMKVIALLMRYGARVPDVSKWGAWYYLWIEDVAAHLLASGMNPNHMNCHHTTVLHDMAYKGDRGKAALLIQHQADVNAIDEEFRSTPLGLAARWGHENMVALLLEHGADPNLSGAPWSTPLAWAKAKGHPQVERRLRSAGAVR